MKTENEITLHEMRIELMSAYVALATIRDIKQKYPELEYIHLERYEDKSIIVLAMKCTKDEMERIVESFK